MSPNWNNQELLINSGLPKDTCAALGVRTSKNKHTIAKAGRILIDFKGNVLENNRSYKVKLIGEKATKILSKMFLNRRSTSLSLKVLFEVGI